MSEQPLEDEQRDSNRTAITDSPWFWAYVFSAAALAGLALAGPKYFPRQTQLERQFLARQEGGQTIKGADGKSIEPPDGKNLIVTLGPLFLICGALLVVAWSRLWWSRVFPDKESKQDDSTRGAIEPQRSRDAPETPVERDLRPNEESASSTPNNPANDV